MTDQVLDALNTLEPSSLDYQEWIEVGMALKAEGHPCSVWDSWSRGDPSRYHPGECEKKWETFADSGITGGTIVHLAKKYSNYTPVQELDWDDGLDAYYEETLTAQAKPEEKPYQMAVRYLQTLFQPDEKVSFVSSANQKDDGKWVPANGGSVRVCSEIIKDLNKHRNLEYGFGSMNDEAGAWIRINPTEGPSDKQVTRWAYSLVESDSLPIEEQKKLLINLKLPIAALVESGGKSVHAVVKVDAKDQNEYRQRVDFLYDWLSKHNFIVDGANKNPARLSRLPGAMRGENLQRLLAVNIGCGSWLEWIDMINGTDDDLPEIKSARDMFNEPAEEPPEIIEGILRKGAKMIVTGDSKSGKTCLLTDLAICFAEGWDWMGHKVMQGRVLYINLEVMQFDFEVRYKAIYKAHGKAVTEKGKDNFEYWNLRGRAETLEKLAPKIISRCRNRGYIAIIVDPIYKVQGGDENAADAIGRFCAIFDKMAEETGAAMIYVHHHAKGLQGGKKVMDRGSGSGVFSRDADAILDFTCLVLDPNAKDLVKLTCGKLEEDPVPLRMEAVLRSFRTPDPINMFFIFPLHIVDDDHILDGAAVEGSAEANRMLSPNNQRSDGDKKEIVDACFNSVQKDGVARFVDMYSDPICEVSDRTLKKYILMFPDDYMFEKGIVRRLM